MSSPAIQNPVVQVESKSAKKKKAKAEQRTESPAPSALSVADKPASIAGQDGHDESSDNAYIREVQKNIRNLNKKITNASKTDSIIDQHKDKSLEELVDLKIINPDQRAQRLKKPQLESQLAQLEEQLAQYRKIDDEYRSRATVEKASLEKSLTDKFEKEKAEAINEIKEQAVAEVKKVQRESLLVLSQFLRLAAARRVEAVDSGSDENQALEGVLLNVYSGDEHAVSTIIKLVEGTDEKTLSVAGEELQTTFGQVKALSIENALQYVADAAAEPTEVPNETAELNGTDPTVAHAGLTEIDTTGATAPLTNGHVEATPVSGIPENADVADGAANAAAESQWGSAVDMSASQEEWVKVPRDPTETETGLTATAASIGNVQSWADEQPENPPEPTASAPIVPSEANDGFHQVNNRNRPARGDREGGREGGHEGGWRGRGRGRGDHRSGYRGHGHSEGRGRGRGRGRGGMGTRGGRPRNEES